MTQSSPRELLMSVAQDMLVKGWQPVWCLARQSGAYTPIPGTTGGTSPWPAVEPQPAGAHRLAFRPPPSVIIFDVDHYDAKRGADTMDRAEEWLGELPETFKVTSRGIENPSGRYLYRKPEWLDFTDSALSQFADDHGSTHIEVVRTAHRFSWAPGDINHKNGLQVQCFSPDEDICLLPDVSELPELPERWVAYLANPPVAQSYQAYTRPSDGPEWWLSQADNSLGSDAELASFAFSMLLSRVPEEIIWEQWKRVSRDDSPGWPWDRPDFDRHVRDQAQAKAAAQLEKQERERAALPATEEQLGSIAAHAQAALDNKQLIAAAIEPQIPFDPVLYQQMTYAAGITPPEEDDKQAPLGHMLRRLPEYDKLLWQELARDQARKDAAVIRAGQFSGYVNIADLPDPPVPETLIVTGKENNYSRVIGRGTVTVISGHRSSGKTWAVATWAAQELRAGHKVIWLDFERQDMLLNAKFKALGIQRHLIAGQLQYTPRLPSAERLVADIQRASNFGQFRVLLVVDAFRTLQNLVAPGTSASDGDAVEQVYLEYLTPARDAGATIVLLDHMPKGGTTTFGSERKESATDYVIKVEKTKVFSRNTPGYSCLTMTKDRYGNTEEGAIVGYLWVPGDGSASAEEGIRKYPMVPELRNWAPEEEATLDNIGGGTEKGNKELAVITIVSENRLQLGPRPLGTRVFETYPDLFTSAKAATDFARRMAGDGKLVKEDGKDGKYDLPEATVTQVHSPGPESKVITPEQLEHPEG